MADNPSLSLRNKKAPPGKTYKSKRGVVNSLRRRDGTKCYLCRKRMVFTDSPLDPLKATIDHILPRSLGGSDRLKNLKLAHRKCNQERGNLILEPTR